jgi:hypothetical protein
MEGIRTAVGALAAAALLACHGSTPAPSAVHLGVSAPVALTVIGPSMLAPGETAQYTAVATMSDHTTQDYTSKAGWGPGISSVLTVDRNGQATAVAPGDGFILANIEATPPRSTCCSARTSVLVLAPNTYRLTGNVLESGLPVQGATITVLSGVGSGLSTITNYDGEYRVYGVAGALQIRMTKRGYVDIVKTFTASQNDVLDFPDAHQQQTLPVVAGGYVLTIQADPDCPTTSPNPYTMPLPSDMRQPRSYAVQVTQDGPALHVIGAAPTFLPPSDRFDGRITPDGITFLLGNGYTGYGPDDGMTAHLSPMQALSYEGAVTAARSGSTIVGRLNGELQLLDVTTRSEVGRCDAPSHPFSLSVAMKGLK